MPRSDLDEATGRTTDGISRGARFLAGFAEVEDAVAAGDRVREQAAFAALRQLYDQMSSDERWEVARQTGAAFARLAEVYERGSVGLPPPQSAAATEVDVRRAVQLTERVAHAFGHYTDGSGHDAKQLAAIVPRLLDDHVHLKALRRAGYGVEEIKKLDEEIARLRAASGRETQASISAWAEKTFGPAGSNARAIARANREMAELLEHITADEKHPEAAEEIADIVIVLSRVMTRLGADLQSEIDRKMAVNRARKWRLDGTGHGYHVDEPDGSR